MLVRQGVIGDLHLDKLKHRVPDHLARQFATLRGILSQMEDEGLKEVVLLGDVLDKPTVSVDLLMALTAFLNEYRQFQWLWVLGNHDKTSGESSQVDLLRYMAELGSLPHLRIVNRPLRRKGVGYLPYPYNRPLPATVMSYAHVDRPGARTDTGRVLRKTGKWREDHRYVIGHIHTEQQVGDRTHYLGAPFQLSWGEMGAKYWGIAEYDTRREGVFQLYKREITPQYQLVNLPVFDESDLDALTPPESNIYYRIMLQKRIKLPRNLLTRYPNAHLDGGFAPVTREEGDAAEIVPMVAANPKTGLRRGLRRRGFTSQADLIWAKREIDLALANG